MIFDIKHKEWPKSIKGLKPKDSKIKSIKKL